MSGNHTMTVRETWTDIGGGWAHAWILEPGRREMTAPLVVVVPGLGLPTYTRPTAHALVRQGLGCAVLDVPGFGSGGRRSARADIHSIGRSVASWVLARAAGRPVVLVGHSTGAQAALGAALALQEELPQPAALVMAGPTFAPEQRRVPALLAATPAAYRQDTVREISLRDVARARLAVASIIRSGIRDAPEMRLAGLRMALTLTAGEHDAYAPGPWLATLAAAAGQAAEVRTVVAPGTHNNLYTHPLALMRVIADALPSH